ncbi:MAG: ABC transporter substrate-binding protein [Desulfovibrio sp.]|jgi:NitT/TauT family transport system substrate-binding protein|nr:ABC transporter substrate-binding protein [Desulfovibrio sp.]
MNTAQTLGRSIRALAGRILLLAAALPALLLLSAVRAEAGQETLRMAYLQNDLHHLAFWVGMDKGFLTQEGLAVDMQGVFRSGPELMAAFGAGELDAAYVGEAPAAIASIRGTAKILLLAQANTEGSALVSAKDLKAGGEKPVVIAIPGAGGVQDLLLRKALPALGIDPKRAEVMVLGPPEMSPSLLTGKIDAFIAWEPYPSQALALGAGQRAATSADIWPNHPCCALIISEKLAAERPEAVKALLRAHRQATEYIAGHPDEAAAVAVNRTGMKEDTVKQAMSHVKYVAVPDVAGLEDYITFLNELGFVKVENPKAFAGAFIASKFWETK